MAQWTVWRQDDNGHRWVVAHHPDHKAAEAQADEMQARGHKQLYWVESTVDHKAWRRDTPSSTTPAP